MPRNIDTPDDYDWQADDNTEKSEKVVRARLINAAEEMRQLLPKK